MTVGNESKFVTMTENEAEDVVEKEKDVQHHISWDQFLLQESQVITSTTEQVTSLSGGFQMTAADVDQFLFFFL